MARRDLTFRVFVSSAFSGLKAERNALQESAFPRLRAYCQEKGARFQAIDLRWGISDEQKVEGKVLPICLEEIQRCRPYFIGLLGERYWWVPAIIPGRGLERFQSNRTFDI